MVLIGVSADRGLQKQVIPGECAFRGAVGYVLQKPPHQVCGGDALVKYLDVFIRFGAYDQTVKEYAFDDQFRSDTGGGTVGEAVGVGVSAG